MYKETLLKTPLCVLFDFEPSALGMNNNQAVPSFWFRSGFKRKQDFWS